jgi:uncharacterized protein YqgV (UPF0045/DUF77 family)
MKVSVEISYYPFVENAEEIVGRFLEKLNKYSDLRIITNFMSTQIIGEYRKILELLDEELLNSFNSQKSVFLMKITNACKENCSI